MRVGLGGILSRGARWRLRAHRRKGLSGGGMELAGGRRLTRETHRCGIAVDLVLTVWDENRERKIG
jgi:hypothetical protein